MALPTQKETTYLSFKSQGDEAIEIKDMPFPKLVMVNKLRDPSKSSAIIDELSADFEAGFLKHYAQGKKKLKVFQDLELGPVKAKALLYPTLFKTISQGEAKLKLNGDFQPHSSFWKDHFVLSTSKATSLEFIQDKSKAKHKAQPAERIAHAHLKMKGLLPYFEMAAKFDTKQESKDLQDMLDWFGKFSELIEHLDGHIDQHDDGYSRSFKGEIVYPN